MSWPRIAYEGQVTSTNDLALQGISDGAPHGSCWVAEEQTGGRGRRRPRGERRSWFSPAHQNLYLSVIVRPSPSSRALPGLTLVVGLAVCEVLREQTDIAVQLKWPNDLYVGPKKLGGILCEAVFSGGTLDAIAVGVGVNCLTQPADVPPALSSVMTSLVIEGAPEHPPVSLAVPLRDAILDRVSELERFGYAALRRRIEAVDATVGRPVEVAVDGVLRRGVAVALDDEGLLVVRFADGRERPMASGEVRVLWELG